MYQLNLALNNLLVLICHKTQQTQTIKTLTSCNSHKFYVVSRSARVDGDWLKRVEFDKFPDIFCTGIVVDS